MPGSEPGTTRTVTVHGTVVEARRERRRLLAAGRSGARSERGGEETLREFAVAFFRTRAATLSPFTLAGYEVEYRYRIDPELGHLPLHQITRERVERWLAGVAARSTSRRMTVQAAATLRTMLATAVRWGRIAENPAARLALPAPEPEAGAAQRVLDEAQLTRLLGQPGLPLRTETMLRAAAEGGLRRGEIVGLRWADVDLEAQRLNVYRSYERTTKGKRSRRIFISPTFAARLGAWRAESHASAGAAVGGPVWPGRGGGLMERHTPTQAAERALRRAGLLDAEGRALVSLHGLRHTCASLMLRHGVPLVVVSRHLGHAHPNITASVYAHLANDRELEAAAEVFGAILAESG